MAIELRTNAEAEKVPCRVMVVDDSAVARGIVTRSLEQEQGIKVVASAPNGVLALKAMLTHEIDVVVLDIEMPELDGMAALPRLLAVDPDLKIIMASAASHRDADIAMRAMAIGAVDFVQKPSAGLGGAENFRRELIAKVKHHAACRGSGNVGAKRKALLPSMPAKVVPTVQTRSAGRKKMERPDIIAIGSSTGGPQALAEVLRNLAPSVRQPILVTQHMPASFTALLAEHMARYSGRPASEARDGQVPEPGHIYIAPGGQHLVVEPRAAGGIMIRLDDGPPENSCKPAVDPMLRSLARIFKDRLLAVILTGMGCDGLKGCEEVIAEGGSVLAQDQETSVVWGMPGAVAQAGLCSEILPLTKIGPAIVRIAGENGK
ncbi:MAG: chemotaxis response regulator protein-glutamate methylesterase [Parvibaculum sp.]|uniref:protein-glutamate methylesterase/protein-glutamine glutaminase n=1 Tax=Parvibaculum sp. TaxID=2024848 RepID=UPI00271D1140|nr:chemotaxis response regulator protein-glutamate methylesterase [Parvibaculum sp.]MDO8839225.1 chemotaxis response regulator protein-glutamate methylesterase [Parvibaculum sp.]